MATIKVRLKDASENVLHPETDWSVVRNKPSITVGNNVEIWDTLSDGSANLTNIRMNAAEITLVGLTVNLEAGSVTIKDQITNNKKVNLVDYPSKPKGVLKSKNMTVQSLINDKNLIDKIVKIEKIEFGVGGYIRYRYNCDWSWSSGSSGTLNDYILYYTNESGNNTKVNNSDSILVTYLDLPITFENMPMQEVRQQLTIVANKVTKYQYYPFYYSL